MWRSRSLWVSLAAVAYVGAAALRPDVGAAAAAPVSWAGAALGLVLVVVGHRLVREPTRGVDRIDPWARSAARVVSAGAAMALVAQLSGRPQVVLLGRVGIALAGVGSLVALGRVASLGGIAARKRRRADAAPFVCAVLWLVALGLSALELAGAARLGAAVPLWLSAYGALLAALGTLAITAVAASRLYLARRHEIGVAERAAAALWLSLLSGGVGVLATLTVVADPSETMLVAATIGSLCATVAAVSQDATFVSRLLRTAASVTLLCAPLVCVAVFIAYKAPTYAGSIVFVTTILAAAMGLLAPKLAAWLAPERGRHIEVLEGALRAAKAPDPRQALTDVLSHVRRGFGDTGQAYLFRFASGDCVSVDRAGYLHEETSGAPALLEQIAAEEPERVVSTEALRSVEVERPDVREVVAWLDERGAAMTATVMDEDVAVGLLLWPSAGRRAPIAYQELVALRQLSDLLGAATGAAAQLARSRRRELDAEQGVRAVEEQLAEARRLIERHARRRRALAETLVQPIRVACYSPAAQAATLAAERFGRLGDAVSLLVPAGVDAVAWAALIHLASDLAGGSFLTIEGTLANEQSLERWKDAERSPLTLARDGTLLLRDAHALPLETQRFLAHSLITHLPDERMGLVVTLPAEPAAMVAAGDLDESLGDLLGDRVLALPRLADRAEDLRALALHRLVQLGTSLRGRPFGLSLKGQQLVAEHDWPGNDAQLEATLLCAALQAEGDVVGEAELARVLAIPNSRRRVS